jgi:hypothetical protein
MNDFNAEITNVLAEIRRKRDDDESIDAVLNEVTVAAQNAPPPAAVDAGPAPSLFDYYVREVLIEVEDMLLEKNRKYGNSALEPLRIFSRAGPLEQIDVRIDDKLSRLRSRQDDDTEDAERDTLGYLVLKEVARRMQR